MCYECKLKPYVSSSRCSFLIWMCLSPGLQFFLHKTHFLIQHFSFSFLSFYCHCVFHWSYSLPFHLLFCVSLIFYFCQLPPCCSINRPFLSPVDLPLFLRMSHCYSIVRFWMYPLTNPRTASNLTLISNRPTIQMPWKGSVNMACLLKRYR